MTYVRERFSPVLMAADTSYSLRGQQMGGFLAKTSGTITVKDGNAATVVDAVPVTAGVYLPIPVIFNFPDPKTVTLAGGASGTLLV